MNINQINTAARDIIAAYNITALTTRARIDAAVATYCDNPATTRTDMLRIRTRIESLL